MQHLGPVPGVEEAVARYGEPERRCYDLGASGEDERFWEMWGHRRGEVVLVLQRPDGRVWLQTKAFYPAGAYRLPTGSIKIDEPVLAALQRETQEETGRPARTQRLMGVLCYRFLRAGCLQERESLVFLLDAGPETPQPEDETEEIADWRAVQPQELEQVAGNLERQPSDWDSWGRFRAIEQRFVCGMLSNPSMRAIGADA
jgi:NAD+ diphosphatase